MSISVIILAAGKGTRMRSSLPKVLQPLAGRPLLAHVINIARLLSPQKICIVIGHGGEVVKQSTAADDLTWIMQEQQLGTGHALMQAQSQLDKDGFTLVLYGDVPLVGIDTLRELIKQSEGKYFSLLTALVKDPFGYGRIIRDPETSEIIAIVEQKDANADQQAINEINTGVMLIPNIQLHSW